MDQAAETPVTKVINALGSASEVSRALGITPQAVVQWTQVPASRVLEIERLTGISRHELRPDIFGEAPSRLPRRSARPAQETAA